MSVFENLVGNEERPESKAGGALAKWGPHALGEGFVILPRALVTRQKQLGLNSNELVVLLNLISSWWGGRRPSLSAGTDNRRPHGNHKPFGA